MEITLHNTLTGKKELFKPIHDKEVGVYSCGPTVYWNQHIGHMYAFVQWDSLVRTLGYFGYKTKWVMNITDVGHLTGDNMGDADTGEDRMEKGAKREKISVWEIADKYIEQFLQSVDLLNIRRPDVLCRATDHIAEQIALIEKIEKNGFGYMTKTGLVFDTDKFPGYADFGHLNLDKQFSGSRVEVDSEKKKPWDFLLWITNQPNHIMKWPSPWGVGFPGWHIECTAMSTKYLGETFDIHTGGKEHVPIHHTNEIAQAYGAFGHQTANYWLHNEWMTLDGEKISKSLGNSILVTDLIDKGYDPLALRYLILTTHYKTGLNFTWQSLDSASTAYRKIKEWMSEAMKNTDQNAKIDENIFREKKAEFQECLADDLNFAKAVGLVWTIVRSKDIDDATKISLLLDFDQVLGLRFSDPILDRQTEEIPANVAELVSLRDKARAEKDFAKSDTLRTEIESLGFEVKDTPEGTKVVKK